MRGFSTAHGAGGVDHVLPRPGLAARPLTALSVLPLCLAIAGAIPARAGLALGATCAAAALARAAREQWRLSRLRGTADEQLLAGARPSISPLVTARARELTAVGNRRVLAQSLQAIVNELGHCVWPGGSLVNRRAALPQAPVIEVLARRLREYERPVSPLGVVLVEQLLTEGAGPLYARARADELGPSLRRCLVALEDDLRQTGEGVSSRTPRSRGTDGQSELAPLRRRAR